MLKKKRARILQQPVLACLHLNLSEILALLKIFSRASFSAEYMVIYNPILGILKTHFYAQELNIAILDTRKKINGLIICLGIV